MAVINFFDKYNNGSVFEISLYNNYGFGYVKLYKVDSEVQGIKITHILLHPINFFSKERLKEINIITQVSEIFTPIILMGNPKMRGHNSWKYIGQIRNLDNEGIIPDFKVTYNITDFINGDFKKLEWYRIKNLSSNRSIKEEYENIKHLGFYVYMNYLLINYKMSIMWMQKNGNNIHDFFTPEDFNNVLGLNTVYQLCMIE